MALHQYNVDFESIDAIDFHVHVEIDSHGHRALDDQLMSASSAYFGSVEERTPTVESIAQYYRARNTAAVVFTIDAETSLGHSPNSVIEIAEAAATYNDILIPFGSVDPLQGEDAINRAIRLVTDFGVKGFKFHPGIQAFEPNDIQFYPLYEAIAALGVPVLFHTGQTGIGAGLPGGRGIRLRYSDPLLLDDVAADFPSLTIVMAHPSVPWVDTQISIATHKSNVFIDLSGWSPKYLAPQLVRATNSYLQDKVLFGSDFPLLSVDRWRADFAALEIKEDVVPKVFKQNALRVLGLI
ncbi:MAG: 4-hydroxyphenyl-beta-ketoacyl-CoA hydrolase [Rhodococcus erythropolis]|nr:amidohydrolase family protein [Rhodococcus erythropolis]MDF2896743.1 4-hydroxyphenyl-beta-ketoacyl-CoA hydrolase [Rhodococcus erythropolis]